MTIKTGRAVNSTVYRLAAALYSGLLMSTVFLTSGCSLAVVTTGGLAAVAWPGAVPTAWVVLLEASNLFTGAAPVEGGGAFPAAWLVVLFGASNLFATAGPAGAGGAFAARMGLLAGLGSDKGGLGAAAGVFFAGLFLAGAVVFVDAALAVFFAVVTGIGATAGSAFFLAAEEALGAVLVLIFFLGAGEASTAAGLTGRAADLVEASRLAWRSGGRRPTTTPLLAQLAHRASKCEFAPSHDMLVVALPASGGQQLPSKATQKAR